VESHHSSCYSYQDLHKRPVQSTSQQTFDPAFSPRYSLIHKTQINGRTSAKSLNAIHFRYPSIRLVSCYTLLRGYRLPWPPSKCLNDGTSFMVIIRSCLAPYCDVRFIPHRVKTLHLHAQTRTRANLTTQLRRSQLNCIWISEVSEEKILPDIPLVDRPQLPHKRPHLS